MGKTKFQKGDRVLCTDNGKYGNVTLVDASQVGEYGSNWYEVIFDDGEEAYLEEEYLELTDVDKKTAFLTELKELFEKYEACVGVENNSLFFILQSEYIKYDNNYIDRQNIFDYDK